MATLSSLSVCRTQIGDCFRVAGRATSQGSPAVLGLLLVQAVDDGGAVVVDLSSCEDLDQRFLGSLIDLHRHYGHGDPPRFAVAATPDAYLRLFPEGLPDGLTLQLERPQALGPERELPPLEVGTSDLNLYLSECHRRLAEVRRLSPGDRDRERRASEAALALAGI